MKTTKRWRVILAATAGIALAGLVGWWSWLAQPVLHERAGADPAAVYLNRDDRMACRLKEGFFTHAGRTLHYVEAGTGEPIVFLHGFPSTWFSFLRQIESLAPRFRVIAIDGLGAGRSDGPVDASAYRLEAMASHVIALLDHLDIDRAHLVGHDWGAAFAFGLAQRHPSRVSTVTGIGAPPQSVILAALADDPRIRQRAAYIERLKRASPLALIVTGSSRSVWTRSYAPLVERGRLTAPEGEIFRSATGSPRRLNAHINWYRANIPAPGAITEASFWPARNARIRAPALVIWGAQDPIFADSYAAAIVRIAEHAELMKIADTGHWPHIDQADKVTAAITKLVLSDAPEAADGPQADRN